MIRAVVDHAEGRGPPPPELVKFQRFQSWNALPLQGGTDDQRYGELERMQACGRVKHIWYMKLKRPKGWEKYAHLWHSLEVLLNGNQ